MSLSPSHAQLCADVERREAAPAPRRVVVHGLFSVAVDEDDYGRPWTVEVIDWRALMVDFHDGADWDLIRRWSRSLRVLDWEPVAGDVLDERIGVVICLNYALAIQEAAQ